MTDAATARGGTLADPDGPRRILIVGWDGATPELIQPWVLALDNRLKIGAMAKTIVAYPTLVEVGKRAAGSYYAPRLFSERTKAVVRFLARFG